jgi:Novel toxin 16
MKRFALTILATMALVPAAVSAQSTGTCTATQHRPLQNEVERACGLPASCSGTDNIATLNSKIANHKACISARTNINNTCFAGGDAGHKQAVAERNNGITRCQDFLKTAKP